MPKEKPKITLENGFMTEDGRFPYYLQAVDEAQEQYGKLKALSFEVFYPGDVLTLEEFLELARVQGPFELVKRGDPNDTGFAMLAMFESEQEAREFYVDENERGREVCELSKALHEEAFIALVMEGRGVVNLAKKRTDGTIQVRRGTIVGLSDSILSKMKGTESAELAVYAKNVSDEDARRTAAEYEANE